MNHEDTNQIAATGEHQADEPPTSAVLTLAKPWWERDRHTQQTETDQPEASCHEFFTPLNEWVDGIPPKKMVLKRDDGQGLIYKNQVNWIHGDSGSGKTWVALIAAVECIQNAQHIIWVNYEDPTPQGTIERLRSLGLTDTQLRTQFHYIDPQHVGLIELTPHLIEKAGALNPTLIVIENAGEALGADGVDENSSLEVSQWNKKTLWKMREENIGVLISDHNTKANQLPLTPAGTLRKLASTSGMGIYVEAIKHPSRTESGALRLTCSKDGCGTFRKGDAIAEITLTPEGTSRRVEVRTPSPEADERGPIPPAGMTRKEISHEAAKRTLQHAALRALAASPPEASTGLSE